MTNVVNKQAQFEAIFRTMFPKVRSFALKLLRSEVEAEDIAQDVFVKLWNSFELQDDVSISSAYIYTITKNKIFDFMKHRAVELNYIRNTFAEGTKGIDIEDKIHDSLYAKEIELLVILTVKNMPEQRQKVFRMSRQEHLSNI